MKDFDSFVDPRNHVSRLVIAHMLILDCIMSGKVDGEDSRHQSFSSKNRRYDSRNAMTCIWVENITASLPAEYRQYARFPAHCARTLMHSFGADTSFWKPLLLDDRDKSLSEQVCVDSLK